VIITRVSQGASGNARGTTATSNSITVTLQQSPIVGNVLVAVVGTAVASTDTVSVVSTVTQDANVTWCASKVIGENHYVAGWSSRRLNVEIWYGVVVGNNATTTITVNLDHNATVGGVCNICEYSGLDVSSVPTSLVDKTASAYRVSSNYPVTGTTATTSIANELTVGGISCASGFSMTAANYGTLFDGVKLSSGLAVGFFEYIVSTTGTYSNGAVDTQHWDWDGCIATFKAATLTLTPRRLLLGVGL